MEEDKYRAFPILKERKVLRTHAVPIVGGVRPFDYSTYQEYKKAYDEQTYKEGDYKKLLSQRDWDNLRAARAKERKFLDYKREKRTTAEIEEGLRRAPKKKAAAAAAAKKSEEYYQDYEEPSSQEDVPTPLFSGTKKEYKKYKNSK